MTRMGMTVMSQSSHVCPLAVLALAQAHPPAAGRHGSSFLLALLPIFRQDEDHKPQSSWPSSQLGNTEVQGTQFLQLQPRAKRCTHDERCLQRALSEAQCLGDVTVPSGSRHDLECKGAVASRGVCRGQRNSGTWQTQKVQVVVVLGCRHVHL